jgi:hypothetical protein
MRVRNTDKRTDKRTSDANIKSYEAQGGLARQQQLVNWLEDQLEQDAKRQQEQSMLEE